MTLAKPSHFFWIEMCLHGQPRICVFAGVLGAWKKSTLRCRPNVLQAKSVAGQIWAKSAGQIWAKFEPKVLQAKFDSYTYVQLHRRCIRFAPPGWLRPNMLYLLQSQADSGSSGGGQVQAELLVLNSVVGFASRD